MRSIRIIVSFTSLALAVSNRVEAQEPDVRDIPPFVMLVVDSSGSMEDLPACTCTATEEDCTRCEPRCDLLNVDGEPPKGPSGQELKKNRWAVTLEALTGKFNDFQCDALARTPANGATYDETYKVPYHQPWKCASAGTSCPYPGPASQQSNGILDSYLETLRFGLMTFDGESTYKGASALLDDSLGPTGFQDTLSTSMPGMWSYGGKQPFKYPGCTNTYFVDTGARSGSAAEGALISLDSTNCASPPCDMYELNATIQDALLRTRPYLGTPIAASLDDLYHHLQTDLTDSFKACRKRYAILITDGAPDPDFRDLGCDCGDENPMKPCPLVPAPPLPAIDPMIREDPSQYKCPYPLAQTLARKLVAGDGTTAYPKQIEKLFVLGMSVNDAAAKQTLDEIADAGGTTKALQADDPNTLRRTLDSVFSPLLNPISRSVPGFATGLTGTQYQISSGFQISSSSLTSTTAPPWVGLIERRRFICNTSGVLESPDLEDKDLLHKEINAHPLERDLFTVLPTGPFVPGDLAGVLAFDSTLCGPTTYCGRVKLDDSLITEGILGVANPTERRNVLEWMRGVAGSPRHGRSLGDIYHSSPALVGTPVDEPGDEAYTRFRERAVVRERPLVMYIATNDGILHAISVEDYPVPTFPLTVHNGQSPLPLTAGEEIWGFVPPMLLGKLKDQLTSHQFNFDGTPVVKDVYFQRGTSAADTDYHSVLITGMRGGGRGYIAMDVTDPIEPKFLWQFTDEHMGFTYGQPEIVQATFKWPPLPATQTVQTRAVAILAGGLGKEKSSSTTAPTPGCVVKTVPAMKKSGELYKSWLTDETPTTAATDVKHRAGTPRCWEALGRALYFVDVETGKLIKKVFDYETIPNLSNGIMFPSPIVGTPTAYQDAVGTIADRGFVMDADGVLWRIDMSSQDVEPDFGDKGWTMRPFHDVFFERADIRDPAETTYERPILSVDDKRRIVVLIGTGDTDNFEKKDADNRIVSLTEVSHKAVPTVPDDYQALVNWELVNEGSSGNGLYPSELVSGAMALFEGQVFASTFISNTGSGDACEYGRGRLWSLSYNLPDLSDPNPGLKTHAPLRIPVIADTVADSDDSLFNVTMDKAEPNLLIQGVGTTQRAACSTVDPSLNSYFSPRLADIEQTAPPAIWVVAQASKGSQRAKSRLGSVQAKIQRPITFSRVTSWATSVD